MTTPDETKLRIGQVRDLLQAEFPDITISKLRFLQDKGIVDPQRTPGGYRIYAAADVEALRVALQMQRDQFMPLRVIRDELRRRLEDGRASVDGQLVRPVGTMPAAGQVQLGVREQLVSGDALVRAAGVSHEFLEECRAADIVQGRREADGIVMYTPDEIGLVALAGQLVELGLELRHLRQVVMAAGRQGGIVEQYAATLLRAGGDEARERGMQAVEAVTAQLAEFLRIAFVRDVKLMSTTTTGSAPPRVAAPLI